MTSSHEVSYYVSIEALYMLEIARSGHHTISSGMVYDSAHGKKSELSDGI